MRQRLADDQQQIERQMLQLFESNGLKDQFLHTLSHEVRTPVHIIRGYIDLLQEGGLGEVSSDFEGAINGIRKSTDDLWHMLSNCLEAVQLNAGRTEILAEAFDVSALVRTVCEEFKPVIRAKGLRYFTSPTSTTRGVESRVFNHLGRKVGTTFCRRA